MPALDRMFSPLFFHLLIHSSFSYLFAMLSLIIVGLGHYFTFGWWQWGQRLLQLGWIVGAGVASLFLVVVIVARVDCQCLSWQQFWGCRGSGVRVVHEVVCYELVLILWWSCQLFQFCWRWIWFWVLANNVGCCQVRVGGCNGLGHGLQLVQVENKLF